VHVALDDAVIFELAQLLCQYLLRDAGDQLLQIRKALYLRPSA